MLKSFRYYGILSLYELPSLCNWTLGKKPCGGFLSISFFLLSKNISIVFMHVNNKAIFFFFHVVFQVTLP